MKSNMTFKTTTSKTGTTKEKLDFTQGSAPHILVLDDDPVFGSMLKKIAKTEKIPLTFVCPNLDIETLPMDDFFDVIIIDYDLGHLNGCQLAHLFNNTPVLLASNKIEVDDKKNDWPTSIVDFIHKRKGAYEILREAIRVSKLKNS